MNKDHSLKKQLQLLFTDLCYVTCKLLIQIFKNIQKVPNLVYKVINQHHFISVDTSI